MYAVIFEVEPEAGRVQDYLDIAARLRPELEKIDGFISIERFKSLSQEGKILSLSFWRDEEAVVRWRHHLYERWRVNAQGATGSSRLPDPVAAVTAATRHVRTGASAAANAAALTLARAAPRLRWFNRFVGTARPYTFTEFPIPMVADIMVTGRRRGVVAAQPEPEHNRADYDQRDSYRVPDIRNGRGSTSRRLPQLAVGPDGAYGLAWFRLPPSGASLDG
jgi:heme-degrading monooxygenase HmoA